VTSIYITDTNFAGNPSYCLRGRGFQQLQTAVSNLSFQHDLLVDVIRDDIACC